AQDAWAVGDRRKALRFAEMAVHFDPMNTAAIELRSDIWTGKPSQRRVSAGTIPAPESLDGQMLPAWLLDDLENAPADEMAQRTAVLHPLDPGQPGKHTDIAIPRKLQ
ncbi:MAG TPA: hypothetical protein VE890_11730, partial [Thermoguttaceae bacterium]|nr:hypothetical protein [Thermoguttaceae bacterium]